MAKWLALQTCMITRCQVRILLEAEFNFRLYDVLLHRTSSYHPSSQYDLNNVERDVKHQTIIISQEVLIFFILIVPLKNLLIEGSLKEYAQHGGKYFTVSAFPIASGKQLFSTKKYGFFS